MKYGDLVPPALLVKSTLHREYMLVLQLWDSSSLITLPKMGVESPSLAKFPSMEVSNVWVSLISAEPVDPCILKISWLPMIPQVGEALVPSIRTGEFRRR